MAKVDDGAPRLLLVDDSELLLRAIASDLADTYCVTLACDGVEALETLRSGHRFDVIVSDLEMPRMNGLELYAALLHDYADCAARFMLFTGSASMLYSAAGPLGAGVPVLSKPVSMTTLRRAIEAVRAGGRAAAGWT